MELPYFSKFLLIAAYLASYNPAKVDRRFFAKVKKERDLWRDWSEVERGWSGSVVNGGMGSHVYRDRSSMGDTPESDILGFELNLGQHWFSPLSSLRKRTKCSGLTRVNY